MPAEYYGTSHGGFDFYRLPQAEAEQLINDRWAPHERRALKLADLQRAAPPDWVPELKQLPYLGPSDPSCAGANPRRVEPDSLLDATRPDVPSVPGCPGLASTEQWTERAALQGSEESRVDAAMSAVRQRRSFTAALPVTPGRGGGQLDVLYLQLHRWELETDSQASLYACAAEAMASAGVVDGRVEQWVGSVLKGLPLPVQLRSEDVSIEAAVDAACRVAEPVPEEAWKYAAGTGQRRLPRWRARCLGDVKELGWREAVKLWAPRLVYSNDPRPPGHAWMLAVLRLSHAVRAVRRRETEARTKEVGWALAEWAAAPAADEDSDALPAQIGGGQNDAASCIEEVAQSAAASLYLSGLAAVIEDVDGAADGFAKRFTAARSCVLGDSFATAADVCRTDPDDLPMLLPQECDPELIVLTGAAASRSAGDTATGRMFAVASRKLLRGTCS
eukprot:TRINITY_DN6298_c0_g1_i2.p2 TRINITY_DN6298_c0_g1~~TRINITY_DN6298_c0_g1_i2.p2  ORF type:complete len:466 (+),score=145.61 TRINITY_DN6298_c0_g1_i2:58-1398(+)